MKGFLLLTIFAALSVAQVTSTGSVSGPNGKSATRTASRSKGSVNSTTTGPNGQAANRSVERSAGSATATTTGPKGKSATRNRTTTKQ